MSAYAASDRWMSFIDIDEFVDPSPALPVRATENVMLGRFSRPRALSDFDEGAMAARRR